MIVVDNKSARFMKDNVFAYDVIRSVAIIFVICIHSLGLVNDVLSIEVGIGQAHIINALVGIVYSGVPLFVMLSGALLLGKDEPIKKFFHKRISKIIWPFLFWSVIAYAILYYQNGGRSFIEYIVLYLQKTATTGVHNIYWYLYMLVGLYIITPPIRAVLKGGGISMLMLMVVVLFVVYVSGKYVPTVKVLNRLTFINIIWVFYYMLGYCVSSQIIYLQEHRRVIYMIFVTLLCFHFGLRLFGLSCEFLDIAVYITLFALMLSIDYKKKFKLIGEISRMSYGVYLSHFMFISALLKLNVFQKIPLIIEPLCMQVSVLVLDMAVLYMLEKMRLKKYIM